MAGIGSAFVDNIPLTAMMLKIIQDMHKDETIDLPLFPLVFSMAFAAGLGGNGSLIGATTNIVGVGLAEKAGYPISFWAFLK